MSSHTYNLLEKITWIYNFSGDKNRDVYVLACQHILEPQAKMFSLMSEFGIPKENIYIFGKIYSTSNEVLRELKKQGFFASDPVFNPAMSFDVLHRENCEKEFKNFISKINSPSKIIILDDGGELLKVVNDNFNLISPDVSVVGIEQTSSGFRKLENVKIEYPIFNVARSAVKLNKESPLIAELGAERIAQALNKYIVSEPRILVVGLGPLGESTLRALGNKGYFVLGHDVAHHGRQDLIDLIKNNNINVVVGVTGFNILNELQIEELQDYLNSNLYLISMSSADREFPAVFIREKAGLPKNVHDDVSWNNLILVNNGFPITFKGNRYESTPKEIERTIALLYASVLEATTQKDRIAPGFTDVPSKVSDIIEAHE
jgi:hypothetical protein